jgi:hypothetical protein
MSLAERVALRFLQSDDRFMPPAYIASGVESGELPASVLMYWKYVVETIVGKCPSTPRDEVYKAGTAYWRNKCQKEGVDLPDAYVRGQGGASSGVFKDKSGTQVEDWVKARLASEKLINDAVRTASEWEVEILHVQRAIDDCSARVKKQEAAIAADPVKMRARREKWLADAKEGLDDAQTSMDKAKKALDAMKEQTTRHQEVTVPVLDFEKQFQTALLSATVDLSKRDVLAQAKAAIAKFEQEMVAQSRQAGVLDSLWSMAEKAWNWVVRAFQGVEEWVGDLLHSTKRLEKLLDAAT